MGELGLSGRGGGGGRAYVRVRDYSSKADVSCSRLAVHGGLPREGFLAHAMPDFLRFVEHCGISMGYYGGFGGAFVTFGQQ